jgi:hypothetical protein
MTALSLPQTSSFTLTPGEEQPFSLLQKLGPGGKSRFELLRSGSISPQTKGPVKNRYCVDLLEYKPDLKQESLRGVAVKEVAVWRFVAASAICCTAPLTKNTPVALSAQQSRLFVTRPHLEKIGPGHFQLVNDGVQQPLWKLAMSVYRYRGCLAALRN